MTELFVSWEIRDRRGHPLMDGNGVFVLRCFDKAGLADLFAQIEKQAVDHFIAKHECMVPCNRLTVLTLMKMN